MFHKEGAKIILITLILVVAVVFASDLIAIQWLRIGLIVLALVFLVLILQFFRNPKRGAQSIVLKRSFDFCRRNPETAE